MQKQELVACPLEDVQRVPVSVSAPFGAVSAVGLWRRRSAYVLVYEESYPLGILLRMVAETHGVYRAPRYPHLLGFGLGVVEPLHHGKGHIGVAVAVDEEHGLVAARHLAQRRCLAKRPTVAQLALQTGGVEQWEGRQVELAVREQVSTAVADTGQAMPLSRLYCAPDGTVYVVRNGKRYTLLGQNAD